MRRDGTRNDDGKGFGGEKKTRAEKEATAKRSDGEKGRRRERGMARIGRGRKEHDNKKPS
jgi:hypothetical protein